MQWKVSFKVVQFHYIVNMRRRLTDFYIFAWIANHLIYYPTPLILNVFWSFGFLLGICLIIQIISGIFLAMHYIPHSDLAFNSVIYIMRDVNLGWFIRYLHCNCASFCFFFLYCHMFRGIYYHSYKKPLSWISGFLLFILMMATAFFGYILPWGQMSYWAVTVITNLLNAFPVIGQPILELIWGGFSVSNATLTRFYSFHFTLPFLIVGLSALHIALVHEEDTSNQLLIATHDYIPFYPYFFKKDLVVLWITLFILIYIITYYPNIFSHPDNNIPANALVTPTHIVPEWYFLPYYAILRSVSNKLGGLCLLIAFLVFLAFLPWLSSNNNYILSNYFYMPKTFFFANTFCSFIVLGWIGYQMPITPYIECGLINFIFFCINLFFFIS